MHGWKLQFGFECRQTPHRPIADRRENLPAHRAHHQTNPEKMAIKPITGVRGISGLRPTQLASSCRCPAGRGKRCCASMS
jgi:hypothetical protein